MSTVKKILLGMVPCLLASSVANAAESVYSGEAAGVSNDIHNMFLAITCSSKLPKIQLSQIKDKNNIGIAIDNIKISGMYVDLNDRATAENAMTYIKNIKSQAMKRVAVAKTIKNENILRSMKEKELAGWAHALCGKDYVESYISGLHKERIVSYQDIGSVNKMKKHYIDMIISADDKLVNSNLSKLSRACEVAASESDATPKDLILVEENIVAIAMLANAATQSSEKQDQSSDPYKINNLIANKALREAVKKSLAHRLEMFEQKQSQDLKAFGSQSILASATTVASTDNYIQTESMDSMSEVDSVSIENTVGSDRKRVNRITAGNISKIICPLQEHKSRVIGYSVSHHWLESNKSSLKIKNIDKLSSSPLADHLAEHLNHDPVAIIHAKQNVMSDSKVRSSIANLNSLLHILGQSSSAKMTMLNSQIDNLDHLRGILAKENPSLLQIIDVSVIAAMATIPDMSSKANDVAYSSVAKLLAKDCARLIADSYFDPVYNKAFTNVGYAIHSFKPMENDFLNIIWSLGSMFKSISLEDKRFEKMKGFFNKGSNLKKDILNVCVQFSNESKSIKSQHKEFDSNFLQILGTASDMIEKRGEITKA